MQKKEQQRTPDEIEQEINELEDQYAEELLMHSSVSILNTLWSRIKELKKDLQTEKI